MPTSPRPNPTLPSTGLPLPLPLPLPVPLPVPLGPSLRPSSGEDMAACCKRFRPDARRMDMPSTLSLVHWNWAARSHWWCPLTQWRNPTQSGTPR